MKKFSYAILLVLVCVACSSENKQPKNNTIYFYDGETLIEKRTCTADSKQSFPSLDLPKEYTLTWIRDGETVTDDAFTLPYSETPYTFKAYVDSDYLTIADGTLSATEALKDLTSITVHSTLRGETVKKIDDYAFSECTKLMTISIPVNVISTTAFPDPSLPDGFSVESWVVSEATVASDDTPEYTFYLNTTTDLLTVTDGVVTATDAGKASTDLVVTPYVNGEKVTEIGENAFVASTSSLLSITLPNTIQTIGSGAFQNCNKLTSIIIPDSVTSIGLSAFQGCTVLGNVIVPDSVITIGNNAFWLCKGFTAITLGKSVETIGEYAFNGCSGIVSIVIPDRVKVLAASLFNNCYGLTSVTFGASVKSYDSSTFSGCSALQEINADNETYKSIDGVLYSADKTELIRCPAGKTDFEIPNSVTSIGAYAFSSCKKLTSITIPDGVKTIGNRAFSSCTKLESIKIPNSVTSLGTWVFTGCSGLISAELPDSITTIEERTFDTCSKLASVKLGKYVTDIGDSAFYSCKALTEIELPSTLTTIGRYAFSICSGLTSISIPNSVTTIGGKDSNGTMVYKAFSSCSKLTDISIDKEADSIVGSPWGAPNATVSWLR